MIERFQGSDGERRLRRALLDQVVVGHDDQVAGQLQAVAVLQEIEAKTVLITQSAEDSDFYLVLAGSLEVEVNGRILAVRGAGTHVGEMAMLDPKAKRSATVCAVDEARPRTQCRKGRTDERHQKLTHHRNLRRASGSRHPRICPPDAVGSTAPMPPADLQKQRAKRVSSHHSTWRPRRRRASSM